MLKKLFGFHQQEARTIRLLAPLSGTIVPLAQVPDPVFAQKLAGDGIAIDPINSRLVAPVDAVVSRLFHTNHAIGLTAENGIEILMHIGIESVKLKGKGFQPFVVEGERVKAGDVLLAFEPELLKGEIPSLISPMLITNMDRVAAISPASGTVAAGQDPVLTVTLK
ncbi:MAG TPA: PTS glucose transporter subunit IIA [Bacilli bacterium]